VLIYDGILICSGVYDVLWAMLNSVKKLCAGLPDVFSDLHTYVVGNDYNAYILMIFFHVDHYEVFIFVPIYTNCIVSTNIYHHHVYIIVFTEDILQ